VERENWSYGQGQHWSVAYCVPEVGYTMVNKVGRAPEVEDLRRLRRRGFLGSMVGELACYC
jgi:hypothetical protein